jgi:hypothetical protein
MPATLKAASARRTTHGVLVGGRVGVDGWVGVGVGVLNICLFMCIHTDSLTHSLTHTNTQETEAQTERGACEIEAGGEEGGAAAAQECEKSRDC